MPPETADARDDRAEHGASAVQRAAYLDLTYSETRAPRGTYPDRLARHLHETVYRRPGRLLDVGCGRGEFLAAFAGLGHAVAGVDISPRAPDLAPGHEVRVANLERENLPFEPRSFDFAFSKSVIEHVRDPLVFCEKVFDALAPGGTAIVMTPSWVHNAWGPFYVDHTHVTPFTAPSLEDVLTLAGFEVERVEHFMQLPLAWNRPAAYWALRGFARLSLPYRPMHKVGWPESMNKIIRFAREIMLLAVARKPAQPPAET